MIKRNIKVTFPNPTTLENWDSPKAWAQRTVTIIVDDILFIGAYTWHDKKGYQVYLLNNTASEWREWHFVEEKNFPEVFKHDSFFQTLKLKAPQRGQ